MKISPSMLACDFANLEKEIKKIEKNGADYVHLDVMDGIFVPNISFGAPVIRAMRGHSDLPFDVHLMIDEPSRFIEDFAKSGADIITIHVEAASDVAGTIKEIKKRGIKCGLSVKPGTLVEAVYPYLSEVDLVLVMTVEPGFGGQKFMPEMMAKVKDLRKKIDAELLNVEIEVDGGIDEQTAKVARQSGADVCVAGTAVFGSMEMAETIRRIKEG